MKSWVTCGVAGKCTGAEWGEGSMKGQVRGQPNHRDLRPTFTTAGHADIWAVQIMSHYWNSLADLPARERAVKEELWSWASTEGEREAS
ncbi:hypothetical protein E2C01_060241 [Portunus trituberculatus]|uniref:Uncharacterized protein n=1 Tax=Portunus trituberculatus TaxID=210409 RepID=A0A5B7HAU4_PORTR|nr:hypothetical protein [Portunus trituberculatus]